MQLQPIDILLIVLVIAAVWAVAELALTLRKARATMDEVSHSATEAIDQATPIIAKLDGVVDDIQPALREVTPLVEKVGTTLDEANESLVSVNSILGDVSSATHGVSAVGESAGRIVNTATSAAVGVVSKVASFGGINIPEGQQLIAKRSESHRESEGDSEQPKDDSAAKHAAQEPEEHKRGYVTYGAAPVDDATEE